MHKFNFFFLTVLFLASCGDKPATPEVIYGQWQGVSWTVEGKEAGMNAAAVKFQFFAPQEYEASFGDQQEKGTFSVTGDKLYTNAEGQMQKMVRMVRLTADTLEMEMNRAGVKENLLLKKVD